MGGHGLTHGEAQLPELLGAERAAPLVAQSILTLRLERSLAEAVENIPLVLGGGRDEPVCIFTAMPED